MKKYSYILMAAAILLFAGCTPGSPVSSSDSEKGEAGLNGMPADDTAPSGDHADRGDGGADVGGDAYGDSEMPGEAGGGEAGGEPSDQQGNSQAGRVTAGEWNDLDNWEFWGKLMTGQDYASHSAYWGFYTNNRVAVTVRNAAGIPVSGVKVSLMQNGQTVWMAQTDNLGHAECWAGLFQLDEDAANLKLKAGDVEQDAVVTSWDCPNGVAMNNILVDASPAANKADIAFIVDATGSMGDEIQFLKDDLMDILNKVGNMQSGTSFRTGAVFYRDEGREEEYLTRVSQFSASAAETVNFISRQDANGGGDYPEAVHIALAEGLQSLSWSEDAKTRIAFLLLDAPAHHKDNVIQSLQQSVSAYAQAGIKIIPISASGIDKSTEFMLRFFAAATGGTYVFITNDSGIGGEHIEASVGDYEVELLNDLIVRLINKYTD
ncbi:MAG: VWA domain-containing protein [Bacteroidales bacterium]|nr:VWA domain-containing protein [Bacteroidales bacterium]